MSPLDVLIELTALAGLLVSVAGMVLFVRESRAVGADSDCQRVFSSPPGRLILGLPNAAIGIAFYLAVMIAFVLPGVAGVIARSGAALAAIVAAAVSVRLLWSLMSDLRRPCSICLTGNAINLFLAGLIVAAVTELRYAP